jgi:hypothetical protein
MITSNFNSKLMLAAAVVIVLNFSSCKKYEDGPMFSLLTKKARLTGEWEVVKIAGESPDVKLILEFEKNGDFNVSYSYGSYSDTQSGDWDWVSGKEAVKVTLDGEDTQFDILRLTNKEFWFEDDQNDKYECEKK